MLIVGTSVMSAAVSVDVTLIVAAVTAGCMATIRSTTQVGRAIQLRESGAATDTDAPPAHGVAARRTDNRCGSRNHRRARAATRRTRTNGD